MFETTTSEGVHNNTKIQQPVSDVHIARGLMHRRSQDFGLDGGANCKSHTMTSS